MPDSQRISVIIPVLNEANQLIEKLQPLQKHRQLIQLILADGGSHDGSTALATAYVDQIIISPAGRARQMNCGFTLARNPILLFLHADTLLPSHGLESILRAIDNGYAWGRFDVRFDDPSWPFTLIASMMNWRSRLTGICTGDQALFVRRDVFEAMGGFPEIALMEDIAISKLLLKHSKPCCLDARVTTAARRWQRAGIIKTMTLMWRLRLCYFLGANPDDLARRYYGRS